MHHLRLPQNFRRQNAFGPVHFLKSLSECTFHGALRQALKILQQPVNLWAALGGPSLELTWVVCAPLVDPGLLGKGDYAVCHSGLMDV